MRKAVPLLLALLGTAAPLGVAALHYYGEAVVYQQGIAGRLNLYAPDPETGYKLRPGLLDLGSERVETITDGRGARVAKNARPPGPGGILAVGCSFTYGLGVRAEEAFPAQLENRIGVPVYNLGVPGFSTITSYLRVKQFLDLRPRAVVYAIIDDHANRNVAPCAWSPDVCRTIPHLEAGHRLVPPDTGGADYAHLRDVEAPHPVGWRDVVAAARRDWIKATGADPINRNAKVLSALPPRFAGDALEYAFGLWEELAEKEGFEFYVVYVSYHKEPDWTVVPAAKAMKDRPRFHFVDASPRLSGYRGPGLVSVSENDAHPGPIGHGLIADAIAEAMRAHGSPRAKIKEPTRFPESAP